MAKKRFSRLQNTAFSILRKKYVMNYEDFVKELIKEYRKVNPAETKSIYAASIKRSIINLYMRKKVRMLWHTNNDFKYWDGNEYDLRDKIDGIMLCHMACI